MGGASKQSSDHTEDGGIWDTGDGLRGTPSLRRHRCENEKDFCDGGTQWRPGGVWKGSSGSIWDFSGTAKGARAKREGRSGDGGFDARKRGHGEQAEEN